MSFVDSASFSPDQKAYRRLVVVLVGIMIAATNIPLWSYFGLVLEDAGLCCVR